MLGKRFTRALVVTTAASLIMAMAVFADNLTDTLAAGSVSNPTIAEGGTFSTTINYQIQQTGSNNTTFPATVDFELSGAPSWVSLSAASQEFTGYSDVKSVVVSGTAPAGSGGSAGTTFNFSVVASTTAPRLNTTPGGVSMAVTVEAPSAPADTTPPTIDIVTPVDGAIYIRHEVVIADYTCADELGGSGLASCVGTVADGAAIDTSTLGSKTFTVNAADNAGNPASETVNYTVALSVDGFDRPVDMDLRNVVKAGQAVPLKFHVSDALGPVTDLTSVSVKVASLTCDSRVPTENLEDEAATGKSGLQNHGDGYYQFNWATPKSYANSCKELTLTAGGGFIQADFEFKK